MPYFYLKITFPITSKCFKEAESPVMLILSVMQTIPDKLLYKRNSIYDKVTGEVTHFRQNYATLL